MARVPTNRIGVDGLIRSNEEEKVISLNVASLFNTDLGQEVMKYLRSITIEYVNGANVTNDELRHIEGQRYIVGLIEQRINHANNVKKQEG